MRMHSEYITVQTEKKREFMNITANVKSAMEKSGMRDGIILVASLHSNSAVFINDDEAGLLEDIADWLDRMAPFGDTYRHAAKGARAESNAGAHMQSILLNQQAVMSFTEGKIEMGPWQQVIYAELDGQRPKRIHIKLLGE
jgi:secondary thiamine-phosphate synthase enzyme